MVYANIAIHKKHTYLKNQITVNYSCILIFLRQSTCYVITPNTHQWYKINANKIFDSYKLAPCDDHSTHMIPIPPAEPPEINPFAYCYKLHVLTDALFGYYYLLFVHAYMYVCACMYVSRHV